MATLVELSEVRAEGLTVAQATDARVNQAIIQASDLAERVVRMPLHQVSYLAGAPLLLDGSGTDTLWLPYPVAAVTVLGERSIGSSGTTYTPYLAYDYELYGVRGEGDPDDRSNPRLVRTDGGIFPEGNRNIYLVGVFGWTELADDPADIVAPFDQIERAPSEVRRAVLLMVINDLVWLLTDDERQDDRLRRWISSENTEGHSYSLDRAAMSQGRTGLREADKALAWYRDRAPSRVNV